MFKDYLKRGSDSYSLVEHRRVARIEKIQRKSYLLCQFQNQPPGNSQLVFLAVAINVAQITYTSRISHSAQILEYCGGDTYLHYRTGNSSLGATSLGL